MNDFAGLTPRVAGGGGIGELPRWWQPDLSARSARRVMPTGIFGPFDLSLVQIWETAHFKTMSAV